LNEASRESVRSQVGFIAPIEGLRGVAVLLVVMFHYAVALDARFADPWIAAADASAFTRVIVRNGMLGVDLFFLITGFLLVLPWLRRADEGGAAPSVRDFWRRRVERILPAYYVQLLVLFLVFVPLLRGLEFWRYNPTYMFENLSAHIFLVHYFSPATSASVSVNGSLWSLALEAQFYLLLPLLAPVFARAPLRTAAAMLACAIAWRWAALAHMDGWVAAIRGVEPRWNISEATARHLLYTQLPGYLGHFAVGMLAARGWLKGHDRPVSGRAGKAWLLSAVLAGATLWALHSPGGWIFGRATWIAALACLAVLFGACVWNALPHGRRTLAGAPLAFAGRVSYSIYLYHLPLLLLVNAYAPALTGSWLVLPLYLAGVFGVAWLSYRYVEARERTPTSSAMNIARTWRVATPQSTWVKRPASMSSPNAIGAMASPVSMPEYTKP
jgi:peptidoglycan/LPS O-acetylase OafA/YrhL